MRNSMLLATLAGFFPVWWWLQAEGNHALWIAMLVFMALRGCGLAVILRRDWYQQRAPFDWALADRN
jgi:MATE family multidrug resistance protein